MVTSVQQHQETDGNRCQTDIQEPTNCDIVIECHEPEDCREETTSPKDIALIIPGGDSIASSSTQCSEVGNDDDDDEEEETDTEDDEWIPDIPAPIVLQQQQQVTTADGNLVLPSADPSNFGEVRVKNSTNVHLGNKTFYKGPVTIKQFVYNNPISIQENGTSPKCDTSPNGNGSTDSPNVTLTLRQKVLNWIWSWRCAAFSCVLAVFIVLIVTTACVYVAHTAAGDDTNVDNSDNSISEGPIVENIRFIERNEWGAQPPSNPLAKLVLPVPYVIISHTATEGCIKQSECTHRVRFAQTFHIESRNWSDIAYNFLVGGDGYVYIGRDWDYIGAHAFGYNNVSIGISFIGTFNTVKPNNRQLHAAKKLIDLGVKKGKIAKDYKLIGHRQVSATLSPGDVLFNIIKTWPHWSSQPSEP
ncbi:peptidoglycan-recognition protein LC isoform X2 [Augochlora pura]